MSELVGYLHEKRVEKYKLLLMFLLTAGGDSCRSGFVLMLSDISKRQNRIYRPLEFRQSLRFPSTLGN